MAEKLNYIDVIKNAFEENDWKFTSRELDDETLFNLPMGSKYLPTLDVKFILDASGDCKIRCYIARAIPFAKRAAMLEVINTLNSKYRYITVSLDSDNDVLVAYDFTIFGDAVIADKQVGTMIYFVSNVIDKCVPAVMKLLWQDDGEEITVPKRYN